MFIYVHWLTPMQLEFQPVLPELFILFNTFRVIVFVVAVVVAKEKLYKKNTGIGGLMEQCRPKAWNFIFLEIITRVKKQLDEWHRGQLKLIIVSNRNHLPSGHIIIYSIQPKNGQINSLYVSRVSFN